MSDIEIYERKGYVKQPDGSWAKPDPVRGVVHTAVNKQSAGNEPVATDAGKAARKVRCLVRITSLRSRLIDERNIFDKHVTDALVEAGRDDPTSQIRTLHINPLYEGKIKDKTIVILDDYLNRGVSFGVSSALLKKAGAKKVVGLAMGKFGNRAHRYDISIPGNPFAPVLNFTEVSRARMTGNAIQDAKLAFLKKFKVRL
jgi:hypothetical protein